MYPLNEDALWDVVANHADRLLREARGIYRRCGFRERSTDCWLLIDDTYDSLDDGMPALEICVTFRGKIAFRFDEYPYHSLYPNEFKKQFFASPEKATQCFNLDCYNPAHKFEWLPCASKKMFPSVLERQKQGSFRYTAWSHDLRPVDRFQRLTNADCDFQIRSVAERPTYQALLRNYLEGV